MGLRRSLGIGPLPESPLTDSVFNIRDEGTVNLPPPPLPAFLLLEDGAYLLLETGGKIILE